VVSVVVFAVPEMVVLMLFGISGKSWGFPAEMGRSGRL